LTPYAVLAIFVALFLVLSLALLKPQER
jgi:hypothetical protein